VSTRHGTGWVPTSAHVRATAGGLGLALAAVLLRRPDALVLAAPLLVAAGAGVWRRPVADPVVEERLGHAVLREGQGTVWHVQMHDPMRGVDDVAVVLDTPAWTERQPESGQRVASLHDDGPGAVDIEMRSTRWGRRVVGPALVVASSPWAAFRWSIDHRTGSKARSLLTLPVPSTFDATAPALRTRGLVGVNRSPQQGSGTEFADIRPFQPGDRLRRIHWPRSLRSGELHVTSTWADHDRHVVLVVDAHNDVGVSEGIDGRASSLDIALRAAGAIAEHHVAAGDRVGLVVLGARGVTRVPAATGRRHLRRMLDVMAGVEPGTEVRDDGRVPRGLGPGSLVVMLSPLVSPAALQRAASMVDRGLAVVVVDCLPPGITDDDADDPLGALAWRIRLLERDREVRHVQVSGIAVVPWRGPGSLDQVLRDLHRRAGGSGVRR